MKNWNLLLKVGLVGIVMGSWENCWTQTTYTWNQTGTASWAIDANWTPTRTTPAPNDILQFAGGGTLNVTSVPTQTIGQLLLSNSSTVNLLADAGVTLAIAGGTGTDLDVPFGSSLNCNAHNAIVITLSSGATGSMGGSMTFSAPMNSTAHRLTAADVSAITFNSGATFTAGTNFMGSAFGTTNENSIVFANGSTYTHSDGGNPFGAGAPNSVVVFQAGSLFKVLNASGLSYSGRTYADFEFATGGSNSPIGSSPLTIDNLTVSSGTLNLNLTGGINIKGNISVASSQALTFSPASANTIIFNGTSAQSITNAGTLTFNLNANITINNSSGVTLNSLLTFNGTLTMTLGNLNLNGNQLTVSTISGGSSTSYIIAESFPGVSKATPTSFTFPIGTLTAYMPCTITGTGIYNVNLSTTASGLSDPTYALTNQWDITRSGGSGTINVDFQWPTSIQGGNFPATLYLFKNTSGTWSNVAGSVPAGGGNPNTASFTSVPCCSGFVPGGEQSLPVELVTFKGILAESKVNLSWQTASELNNSHFSIEKSTNGTTFREIGTVQGQGTSYELNDYSFTDETPARGLNYYRLKQLDFDGYFEYSKVVSVNFVGGKGQVLLFPTVASYEIQVRFPAPTEEAGTIQFFDQSGKLVKLVSFDAELSDLPISVEEFQRGVYFVKVQNGQLFETLRFVRQ